MLAGVRAAVVAGLVIACASHAADASPGYCAQVIDQHGNAVRDATVWVMHPDGGMEHGRGCGQTDAAGRFCISPDADECEGGTLQLSLSDAHGGACAGDLTLAPGARPTQIAMHVEDRPITTLTGRVVDDHGHGVAGASVEHTTIRPDGTECGYPTDVPAVTAADGSFAVRTRKGDVALAVVATGFAVRGVTVHNPSRGNTIVVDPGAAWHGRIRAPDGRLLATAKLELVGGTAQPMADGAFAIDHLPPGDVRVTLSVENDPLLGTRQEWRSVTIAAREQKVADAAFSAGLDLAGTAGARDRCVWAYPDALDHGGPGATGMHVTVMPDAKGHFVFHDLPAGRHSVRTCKGLGHVTADAGGPDVVIPRESP